MAEASWGPAWVRHGSRVALVLLLVAAVAVAVLGAHSRRLAGQARAAQNRESATLQAEKALVTDLLDAETGQRGYVLTGRRGYLPPYPSASTQVRTDLDRLAQAGVPPGEMRRLRSLTEAKLDELARAVRLVGLGDRRDALATLEAARRHGMLGRVKAAVARIERHTLARTDAAADAADRARTAFVAALVALIAALVGLLVLARLSRSFRRASAAGEQRYRTLFDEAPVGMGVLTLDPPDAGRFVAVNKELCRLTGYPREELLATDIVSIGHPEDRAAIQANLEQSQAGRLPGGSADRRWLCADGSPLWVRVSVHVLGSPGDSGQPPTRFLMHVVDISAQKDAEEALRRQALHDPLTDLPNRVLLNEHLARALARARRRGTGVSVLYLDLDDFKTVNDGWGHSVGDEVLRTTADRLRACLRESDTAARLGGDEFLVVSEDMTEERDVATLADRVLAALAAPVAVPGAGPVTVHVSIGAVLDVGGRSDPETLTVRADEAMYAAKRAGKNRRVVVTADPSGTVAGP